MKIELFKAMILALCVCTVLVSCKPISGDTHINISSSQTITISTNLADFTVSNFTTGEEMSNQAVLIYDDDIARLTVHRGGVLRLVYSPSVSGDSDYSCEVTYDVFGETFVV